MKENDFRAVIEDFHSEGKTPQEIKTEVGEVHDSLPPSLFALISLNDVWASEAMNIGQKVHRVCLRQKLSTIFCWNDVEGSTSHIAPTCR